MSDHACSTSFEDNFVPSSQKDYDPLDDSKDKEKKAAARAERKAQEAAARAKAKAGMDAAAKKKQDDAEAIALREREGWSQQEWKPKAQPVVNKPKDAVVKKVEKEVDVQEVKVKTSSSEEERSKSKDVASSSSGSGTEGPRPAAPAVPAKKPLAKVLGVITNRVIPTATKAPAPAFAKPEPRQAAAPDPFVGLRLNELTKNGMKEKETGSTLGSGALVAEKLLNWPNGFDLSRTYVHLSEAFRSTTQLSFVNTDGDTVDLKIPEQQLHDNIGASVSKKILLLECAANIKEITCLTFFIQGFRLVDQDNASLGATVDSML